MLKPGSILHTQTSLETSTNIEIDYHSELALSKTICIVNIQSLIPNNQYLLDRIEKAVCREVNKINKLKNK